MTKAIKGIDQDIYLANTFIVISSVILAVFGTLLWSITTKPFTREIEKASKKEQIQIDAYVNYLLEVANFGVISKDVIKQVGSIPFGPDKYGDETLDFYPKLKFKALIHPFTELIYYPKGSFYCKGGVWVLLYKGLFAGVKVLRSFKKSDNSAQRLHK